MILLTYPPCIYIINFVVTLVYTITFTFRCSAVAFFFVLFSFSLLCAFSLSGYFLFSLVIDFTRYFVDFACWFWWWMYIYIFRFAIVDGISVWFFFLVLGFFILFVILSCIVFFCWQVNKIQSWVEHFLYYDDADWILVLVPCVSYFGTNC